VFAIVLTRSNKQQVTKEIKLQFPKVFSLALEKINFAQLKSYFVQVIFYITKKQNNSKLQV
jgi:hypothetical protein